MVETRCNRRLWWRGIISSMTLSGLLILSACGGGGGTGQMQITPTSQASNAPLQVNIGDSPADRVIAFAMTINSMSLTNSAGNTVNVISSPTPIEMMQLMGTMQPLAMMSIPQGTYTKASFNLGSATATYMDPVTMQPVTKTVPSTAVMLNFNPSVTIGSNTPVIMNFDMDMAASVSIDASGNVSLNPAFKMSLGNLASGMSDAPENGGMQHLFGSVASTSGSSFTMAMMQGAQNLGFSTNSGTHFDGLSGMGMMPSGLLVMVDANMQPDGTMLAQEVKWIVAGGMMAQGLVTAKTGSPATQLTIIAQNGAGSGMMSSFLANGISINVGSSTPYVIDTDGVDLTNLPFTPKFDGTTIFKGQRIFAASGQTTMGGGMGGMMTGTINASEIDLEQQGLSGTVSAYTQTGSQATFTLTLPPDSAFATLSGSTTVTVFQRAGTVLAGLNSLANGTSVHVRGLLFSDSGGYKMVAGRIMAP